MIAPRWAALTRTELQLTSRQGEQLLVNVAIPLGILVFFTLVDVMPTGDGDPVDFLTPSTMALAVMSSSLVALGISTGFDRQYGVLKRLGATRLGRGGLVAGKITAIGVVEVVQLLLLAGVGLALGWAPGGQPWMAPIAFVLGTAAFGGLGLLLAGTLRGTVVLAAANAAYLVLLAFGGMAFRLDELPDGARAVAELFPAAALSEVVRWSLTDGTETPTKAWIVLTVWAVAMPLAAARFFRWD